MRFSLMGVLFLSTSNLFAQTFPFPYNEKECKASTNICSILNEVKKQIPPDVTVSSIEIQSPNLKINGRSPGYKGIGIFINNLAKIPSINGKMDVATTAHIIEANKRFETFQLVGKLTPLSGY
jgi:hypothetical protein